ncbi:MAG: CapA family protein [Oscillospiraceae bacterium]|nr:CapA family protein [Oscillospiraceae bacterium]
MGFLYRFFDAIARLFRNRAYSTSELPVTRGIGRVSRRSMSNQFRSAAVDDARRLHKVGAASRSTSLGKGGARRRNFLGMRTAVFSKWMNICAFLLVVGVMAFLIILAANSGGTASVAANTGALAGEPEADSSGTLTLDDGGSSVTIAIGGMVRLQDEVIAAAQLGDKFDFNNYLSELSSVMKADISLAGLMGSADSTRGAAGLPKPNYPPELLSSLHNVGINLISNANAKSLSLGYKSLELTNSELAAAGIIPIGTSVSNDPAGGAYVKRINSICVGIGAYYCPDAGELSSVKTEQKNADVTEEQQNHAVNQISISAAADRILSDVEDMRAAGAQFIIIYLSWGTEGSAEPTSAQRDLAQSLIDAGVDVTVGTGPNTVQRITKKASASTGKDCYVFYSVGNLFTDVNSGDDVKTQQSLVLSFTLSRAAGESDVALESAKYHPIYCNRDKTYATEKTYLKYRVVPAARYVDAPTRPDAFTTEDQWARCKATFTAIRNLVGDKLVLGNAAKADDLVSGGDFSGGGEPATV